MHYFLFMMRVVRTFIWLALQALGETTRAKLSTTEKPQLHTIHLVTMTFYFVSKVQLIDALAGGHPTTVQYCNSSHSYFFD